MITVIIPTLFKVPDKIFKWALSQYDRCALVEKIIIIDNTGSDNTSYFSDYNKIDYVNKGENLFVNPSWNLGIKRTKSQYYLIVNDDILCTSDILIDCYFMLDNYPLTALITCNTINDKLTVDEYKKINNLDQPLESMPIMHCDKHGWFMFGRTEYWKHIPETLKIFYGDDFIYFNHNKSGLDNCLITNRTIVHYQSSTINKNPNVHKILHDEYKIWVNIRKEL